MEMQHKGSKIRPIITKVGRIFNSSVVIRNEDGAQQVFDDIGRFASANAAKLFAVDWALAHLKGEPLPKPPYQAL
jgi:hypothetical protein